MENKEKKIYNETPDKDQYLASDYMNYLGFVKKEKGWEDRHGLFIYDSKLPYNLFDLVRIISGTAFRKGQLKNEILK